MRVRFSPLAERDLLLEADPSRFFVTPHHRPHPLVLMRPDQLDLEWAKANLIRVWRGQAPRRVLTSYDTGKSCDTIERGNRAGLD